MNCTDFQELLFEWLEGRLDAAEIDRMQAHAASCLRCRELEELAIGDAGLPSVEPPDDMVASILAETSGGACDRALSLVCERLDDSALAMDPLLEMHLSSCSECATVSAALERLHFELPAMAEMTPDANFVDSVLAVTVGAAVPAASDTPAGAAAATGIPSRAAAVADAWGSDRPPFDWSDWVQRLPLAARVSDFLERLSQRPRLAFEGAFVGTLAFVLVLGMPAAGVAELPSRLLAEVRQERVQVQNAVAENLSRATEAGREAWTASKGRLEERFGEYLDFGASTSEVESRIKGFLGRWQQAGIEIATHFWEGEFRAAFARMWRLWVDSWTRGGNEVRGPEGRADNPGGQQRYQS
jgi:hypothetical protein